MPPIIVNESQPQRVSLWYPHGVYSRVIALEHNIKVGAASDWQFTPPLGNEFWLRSIRVKIQPYGTTMKGIVLFLMKFGTSVPETRAQVNNLEDIIPVYLDNSLDAFVANQSQADYEFTLNRHFSGSGIRLGNVIDLPGGVACQCHVWFEISEG